MKRTALYLILAGLLTAQTSIVFVATPEETAAVTAAYTQATEAAANWTKVKNYVKKNHHVGKQNDIEFNKDFTAFSATGEGDDDDAQPNTCKGSDLECLARQLGLWIKN